MYIMYVSYAMKNVFMPKQVFIHDTLNNYII